MIGDHFEGTPPTIEPRQAQLKALHTAIFSKPKASSKDTRSDPSVAINLSNQELIEKAHLAANGAKFGKLWRGDISGYHSQNEADLALCGLLAFWTGGDAARIDHLFRQSGLYREGKWNKKHRGDGATYGQMTIEKALSGKTEFYTPDRAGQDPDPKKQKQQSTGTPNVTVAPLWPIEVMTGAAGTFARTYSNYLETPQCFLFMDYLTILGHVISNKITLESEIRPQPRLYTVNLGESSDARKSTSIDKSSDFFRGTLELGATNPILGVGSAEGLLKAFGKNPRVILILDELKALVQKMRIDASVLLPCMNTLFEKNSYHNHIKNHTIGTDNAELCLLAASTLETYRNMFTPQFLDIGFINRLFIVVGDSQKKFPIPKPMPEDEKETLRQDLREILRFVGEITANGPYAMPIDPQAEKVFAAWYFEMEKSAFTKRLDTYGHRLMPLLAVTEMKDRITPEIAEKVVALLNYQLAARKFADPIDADNRIAKLEERVRRLLTAGPMQKRDLERHANKSRAGSWAWNAALKGLGEEMFYDPKTKTYSLCPE